MGLYWIESYLPCISGVDAESECISLVRSTDSICAHDSTFLIDALIGVNDVMGPHLFFFFPDSPKRLC